jgi:exopolysaccharide biosynthesis polyprenyl glycosylphosphotransferase
MSTLATDREIPNIPALKVTTETEPSIEVNDREIRQQPFPVIQIFLKRVIDVVGATVALIVILPFVPILAIVIKLDSPGPVFFRQKRVCKEGKIFTLYKFRTMIDGADNLLEGLCCMNERTGLLFKMANDPRVTRVGKVLRRYSIDELPQFWNVLKGEMSLVGPRPALTSEFERYEGNYLRRLKVTPGITGLWQVYARRHPSAEAYLSLDIKYIEKWSLWLDLRILLRTLVVVAAGTGE